MIHYILQILIFQLLFLVAYDVFLKKELHFNWNRIYLIVTPILSFILPLIKIEFIRNNIPEEYIIQLPAVMLGSKSSEYITSETLSEITIVGTSAISATLIIQLIWLTGMLVAMGILSLKLFKVYKLKRSGILSKINDTNYISLPKTNTAFSFLNSIFIGEDLSDKQKETIIVHEKIHIEQYHSIDLLFFEFIKVIYWFNPLVYLYQSKMVLLQEFIADEKAASLKGKNEYYNGLLSQVFNTESISFINTFFNHSLIKKRIIMLQKSNLKQNKITQLKYLLLVPIIGAMLVYTSCAQEPEIDNTSSVSEKIEELNLLLQEENLSEEDYKELMILISNHSNKKVVELREEVEPNSYYDSDIVPFAKIDKVPTYPECTGTNEELKKCMIQKIQSFVQKEFNIDLAAESNLTGRQRISVQFKIDKFGNITDVRSRAPHPVLEKEAIRVVSLLPKMIPGEQDGKAVGVLYSLPILFEVKE